MSGGAPADQIGMNRNPVTDVADLQAANPQSVTPAGTGATRGGLATAVQVFRSAFDLVGRMGLMMALGAIGTLAITRLLGPTHYGGYASAIATAAILGAAADFGFSMMLSRDAAGSAALHRSMLRAAYEVAIAWSAVLTVVLVALAISAGLSTDRGAVLLVLAPSMLFNGLNPARVFLIITQRTRQLLLIDVSSLIVQLTVGISVAAAGLGPIAVGITVSAGSIANNIIVSIVAARTLPPGGGEPFSRRTLVRRSAPLGLSSILVQVYLTIDVALLGWLVTGPRLGEYAAASRLVLVLAGVAGAVMSGALPTLATKAGHREELEDLARRICHWLVVGPLPLFVALMLFAGPIVTLALGSRYAHAAPLLRILAIAGCIGVFSNLVGNLMIVFHKNTAMLIQNVVAIAVNVTGNLLLVPIIGVVAAAWMTVATEAVVCIGAMIAVRGEVDLTRILSIGVRPAIAVAAASAVALALLQTPLLAAPVSALTFLLLLKLMGAWPAEFRIGRWRPSTG